MNGNESSLTDGSMALMGLCAVAQTALLCLLWLLVREWAGNLNRKLHRIESNTRHAAEAAGYVDKEPAERE